MRLNPKVFMIAVMAFVVALLLQVPIAYAEPALQAGSVDMKAAATMSGTLETYAGSDRYDVARRIAQEEPAASGASFAGIIVCSCNEGKFPDALSAAGLSGVLGYPVVAVNGMGLTTFDRAALTAMQEACPTGSLDIIIVGGTATVSSGVQTALGSYGKVSKRFAGGDRYEVNRMIYDYGKDKNGGWSTSYAFLARGDNFPDALTIAPYLVKAKCPILLVNPSAATLTSAQQAIVAPSSQVVALGGTDSVPERLLAAAKSACKGKASDRLGGADRYEASANIVNWEIARGMKLEGAGIATGRTFPDSLSSSYLLGSGGSVLILVESAGENSNMVSAVKSAASLQGPPSALRVFGGSASVPQSVYSQFSAAAGWSSYKSAAKGVSMPSKAAYVKSASQCSQMILVEASGTTATVSLHSKDASGIWKELMTSAGYVGRDGVGQASEEKPITPVGSFDIPFAFGNASNPGTSLTWHDTTWESTWVDEINGSYYNTWQESSSYSGEHLKSIGWVYDYALVIGYNYPRYCTTRDARTVSGGGSAFFVHCSEGKPTSGCVSIPTADMKRLVQLVKPGCRIVIGTTDTAYSY